MLWERGRAYSQDLRERVFAAWEAGLRVGEIAEQLLVSIAYVSKALGRERRTGGIPHSDFHSAYARAS